MSIKKNNHINFSESNFSNDDDDNFIDDKDDLFINSKDFYPKRKRRSSEGDIEYIMKNKYNNNFYFINL